MTSTRQGKQDLPELPMASSSTPGSGRRSGHLRKLSLATSPSPSTSSQPLSAGRHGHTPRHLRLSLASSPVKAFDGPRSAPLDHNDYSTPEKSSCRSPTSPSLGTIGEDNDVVSPLASRRPPSAGQPRNGRVVPLGHARRQSSISYRSTPSPIQTFSPSHTHSPAVSPLASRTPGRPTSGFFSPDLVAASVASTSSQPFSPLSLIETREEEPTLLEQHGELLSTIAEKERTCLDLREELKKQESELKSLKAQWEGIVAKDLASARKTAAAAKRSTPVTSPALSRQTSAQGEPAVAAAALSLGVVDGLPNALVSVEEGAVPAQLPDINSAKRWMGGLVKSGMAGVSGILENLAAPLDQLPPPTAGSALGMVVEEEDEPQPGRPTEPDSPASSSQGTDRRQSKDDDFFDETKTRSSSVSSIGSLDASSNSSDTLKHDIGLSPLLDGATTPASWSGSSTASSEANRTPTPTQHQGSWLEAAEAEERRVMEEQREMKHARRRSTFDVLGQTASSWSGSLGKRWGEVTGSETFRGTKRATMSFVDTFERTLADAISLETDGSPNITSPPLSAVSSPRPDAASPALPSGVGLFGYRPPSTPSTSSSIAPKSDVTPKAYTRLDILSEDCEGESGDIGSSPLQPVKASPRPRLPSPGAPSAALTRVRAAHAKRMSMPVIQGPPIVEVGASPEEEEWAKW